MTLDSFNEEIKLYLAFASSKQEGYWRNLLSTINIVFSSLCKNGVISAIAEADTRVVFRPWASTSLVPNLGPMFTQVVEL